MHPALAKGNVAVVTGGASGIGLAAARHLAGLGMRVCIADLPGAALDAASDALIAAGAAEADVMTLATDVSDRAQLMALADEVWARFGPVNLLMNNAGMQPGSSIFDEEGNWDRILEVNLGGIIRGSQIFAPRMIASGTPGLIVNTGSKQGITTPPGDPAYNVSKAGVKAFTEALQHELRNREDCKVEARLFIPGFVYTPLTAGGRTEKPAGAWTPEQVVEFLFDSIERGDFYILCPDNDVDRATDVKRILWAAGDITENRPPLSRWHPDYDDAFKAWLKA
ncbi:SDR family NAD(P)-dependent oxidoreductase [Thioclava nitratireducens]|uniref:SDR family NAD(P)-dependent oxidoreductase n=1 Tax=Thioclava nitratireducens TaxID=1915078 RepID=UPI002481530C|nr:SDR family NAD(P)-dependent oxidoreductase [Thioclava nitratireducens]WGT51243.1 SDR family NAD(P)-dependent oxidoreductase [Thioclava nitratireducens]